MGSLPSHTTYSQESQEIRGATVLGAEKMPSSRRLQFFFLKQRDIAWNETQLTKKPRQKLIVCFFLNLLLSI